MLAQREGDDSIHGGKTAPASTDHPAPSANYNLLVTRTPMTTASASGVRPKVPGMRAVQQIAAGNTNWGTCQKADIETHVRNGERKGSTSTFTLGRTTNWKLCWIPCELGLHIEPLMSVLNENNFRPVEAVTEIATSSVGYGRILGTDPSWGCGNE